MPFELNLVPVSCIMPNADLHGFIEATADIDGTFTLVEDKTNERLAVNGWLMVDFVEHIDVQALREYA